MWKSCDQIPLAFKIRFPLGILVSLPNPQAGRPDLGFRTFITVGGLWYCSLLFCIIVKSHTCWVCNLFSLWLHLSYHLLAATPLSLDVFFSFSFFLFFFFFVVDSIVLLSVVIQQLAVVLVHSQEINACPTLPSWTSSVQISQHHLLNRLPFSIVHSCFLCCR